MLLSVIHLDNAFEDIFSGPAYLSMMVRGNMKYAAEGLEKR